MDRISDWLPVIMTTAVITALLVTTVLRSPNCHREPQIIYIQTIGDDTRGSSSGCLPLAILLLFILLLLTLQAPQA